MRFFSKNKNYKNKIFFLFFVLIFIGLFLGPQIANCQAEAPKGYTASAFTEGINWLLFAVFWVLGKFLLLAGALIDWIIKPENIYLLLGRENTDLYELWTIVRDLLNLAFILVLLFSAFATIFQIEKFHAKKIVLTLIIMALLVNFSLPIARFIIDASNIIMYFFLNKAFSNGANEVSASITNIANITNVISSKDIDDSWTMTGTLIMAIFFVFIFAITLLFFGFAFLIRLIMLAVLLIFSPVGFVASIMPSTNKFSSMWWGQLFKQSFIGPMLAFGIIISVKFFNTVTTGAKLKDSMRGHLTNYVSASPGSGENSLVFMLYILLPIVMLWAVFIASQKMGVVGANAAINYAKKGSKWMARKQFGYGAVAGGVLKRTGISGGVKQGYQNVADRFKSKRESREAWVASKLGDKGAQEKDMKRRAEEYKKTKTKDQLEVLAARGDAAAAYRLAEDKDMEQKTYDKFTANKINPKLRKAVNAKVKQNRNDLVAINKSNDPAELTKSENITKATAAGVPVNQYIANEQMGSLAAEKWNDQNWTDILAPLPAGATAAQIAERTRIEESTITAWNKLKPEAQAEVRKRLSPNNSGALRTIGVAV